MFTFTRHPTAPTDTTHTGSGTFEDSEFWRVIVVGILIGSPMIYLVSAIIGVLAGVGLGNALGLAVIPGVVSGGYFGGLIPLMRQLAKEEQRQAQARRAAHHEASNPSGGAPEDRRQSVAA